MNPINKPVMKLATKGTLDTRAIIPNGARRPTNSVILVVIESKLILTVPAYAKIIKVIAIIAIVTAILEILLTIKPAKYPDTPPIISTNKIGAIKSSISFFTSYRRLILIFFIYSNYEFRVHICLS